MIINTSDKNCEIYIMELSHAEFCYEYKLNLKNVLNKAKLNSLCLLEPIYDEEIPDLPGKD